MKIWFLMLKNFKKMVYVWSSLRLVSQTGGIANTVLVSSLEVLLLLNIGGEFGFLSPILNLYYCIFGNVQFFVWTLAGPLLSLKLRLLVGTFSLRKRVNTLKGAPSVFSHHNPFPTSEPQILRSKLTYTLIWLVFLSNQRLKGLFWYFVR